MRRLEAAGVVDRFLLRKDGRLSARFAVVPGKERAYAECSLQSPPESVMRMLGLTRSFLCVLSSELSKSAFADVGAPTLLPPDRELKIYQ